MHYRLLITSLLLSAAMLPVQSHAQTNSEMADRIDRLQRDVLVLQRQVARGGDGAKTAIDDGTTPPPGTPAAASLEVRLSNLEDQLRTLRGQMEENQHQVKALSDSLDKYRKDTDYRLNELSAKTQPAATPAPTPVAAPAPAETPAAEPAKDKDGKAKKVSRWSLVVIKRQTTNDKRTTKKAGNQSSPFLLYSYFTDRCAVPISARLNHSATPDSRRR